MRYQIFGLALECDTPLPELPRAAGAAVELTAFLKPAPVAGRGWTWVHEWRREDGSAWLRFGRRAGDRAKSGDWLLRLPRLADFLVTDGARVIRCRPARGVPPRTIRHLLIDHIVPVVLSARGHLLLHASGIRTPAGAVLFSGPSGTGKSTLAFVLGDRRAGRPRRAASGISWRPLADDVVRIEMADGRPAATPGYPGARLWPDVVSMAQPGARLPRIAHYSDKRRLTAPPSARPHHAAPIARVLLIEETPASGGIELRDLTPQRAFVALVPHVYRLDADDPVIARAQFEALSRFCDAVAIRSLSFPRRFDRLDDVRRAIARDLDPPS